MDCKKAERLLLYSLDGRLNPGEKFSLEEHVRDCARCRRAEKEYRVILGHLRKGETGEPLPYFKERLLAKLRQEEQALPALLWRRWATKALAFSLTTLIILSAALIVFQAPEPQELSQVETLLLQNENPLIEAKTVLDESKLENKNMMLIFASLEDKDMAGR